MIPPSVRTKALLALALLASGCGSTERSDPYALPLPFSDVTDDRPSGDPGVAPLSSDEVASLSHHVNLDVVYAPSIASGERGLLDVYRPHGTQRAGRRAVIALHGGAWRRGDKRQVDDTAWRLVEEGFVVFAVNYSLAPRTRWPGQLDDCRAALRWIRAHAADYGVDPARIYAWGGSAGGHLAAMLALRGDERVKGAVCAFAPADLTIKGGMAPDEEGILVDLLGARRSELTEKQLADASPVRFARRDASVLVIHGLADYSVSIWHSERLHEALARGGADVKYLRVPGGGHGVTTWGDGEAWRATVRFLGK